MQLLGFSLDMPPGSLILPANGVDRDVTCDMGDGSPFITMKESQLDRTWGGHENDNEIAVWVEYRLNGKLVHRSARVHLKKAAVFAAGEAASVS